MNNYHDITFPQNGNERQLSRILGTLRTEGEYRIHPIALKIFDSWAEAHPQFPHAIQYSNNTLVINIMLPPHDGAAGIIIQHISRVVDRMCPQNDADVWCYTGLTVMRNGVRKNGDAHLYSHQSGQSTLYPGIVVEVGYSDSRQKSRRDIGLWLNHSDCGVKVGIACKVGVDAQKHINLLTFDIIQFDYDYTTRTSPLGRARTVESFDWSRYDGTPQTLPPVTTYDLPSYAVFSDGNYPASFPPHPNPPAPLPPVTNVGRQHPLRQHQLVMANDHVNLVNNQKAEVRIDFRVIANAIRRIRW